MDVVMTGDGVVVLCLCYSLQFIISFIIFITGTLCGLWVITDV
jgi:hypothetical protein